jgi:hypothetical protein
MFRLVFDILFGKEKDDYYEEYVRRDAEIRDIRRRIEEQRNLLSPPQSFHVERHEKMVEQKPDMGKASETERRNKELEDIKAKLMGRKK